jgi:WD40 repeat protein
MEGHFGAELDGTLCLAISADGELLASGGMDSNVRLWSLPGGGELKMLRGHMGQVSSLALTPDGRLLVCGGADYELQLRRLPSGRLFKVLQGQVNENSSLVMSRDGRLLATTCGGGMGFDHTVRLWSLPEGRLVRSLYGHTRHIQGLAFSPYGHVLASASGDQILIWAAELSRLCHLPVGRARLQDLEWVQATLKKEGLSPEEKQALEFIAALIRWRRRSDILVDEAGPRVIELGAFDIEIEG